MDTSKFRKLSKEAAAPPLQMNDQQKNTGESQKTNCLLSQYLTNSNPWTHGICRKNTLKDKRAFPLN